jgi:hypothetical protein
VEELRPGQWTQRWAQFSTFNPGIDVRSVSLDTTLAHLLGEIGIPLRLVERQLKWLEGLDPRFPVRLV